jgi:hypothetical protein
MYNNMLFDTLLDSGANVSIIDATLAKSLGITVTPVAGSLKQASTKEPAGRIGVTTPIAVTALFPVPHLREQLPAKAVEHRFEVLELGDESFQFIIGCDLIHRLIPKQLIGEFIPDQSSHSTAAGEGVVARRAVVSFDIPESMDHPSLAIHELAGEGQIPLVERPFKTGVFTPTELEAAYAPKRDKLMNDPDIVSALAENAQVTGFCNLPETVVHLEIDPALQNKLFRKQYPIAASVMPRVDDVIQRWIRNGKVTRAPPGCMYNSPLLVAPKKDDQGQWTGIRVCLDVRALNAAIRNSDKFQIPKIREALESLAENVIFGEFDLEEAYLQFMLDVDSQPYTAFTWKGVQYMFVGAPFGLSLLPSHFQRAASGVVSDFPFTFAYLDNIPFASKTWEEHKEHALCIIHRLTQCNLKIKPASVKFGHAQMKCLGHVITSRGIDMDPQKRDMLREWPMPKTGKELMSFLGFAQFVRDHVRHFAELTAPLEAVKNDNELIWTDTMTQSFELTKEAVSRAPLLQFPDFSRPFYIATDASNVGVGGVLYQPRPGDDENITADNIVTIHSKILSKSQRNYPAYKKELWGVVSSLRHFHSYIWGRRDLVVYTDHKPLTFVLATPVMSPAVQHWFDVLLDYSFEIRYRPGVLNIMPDALSRMFHAMYPSVWGAPAGVLTVDDDGTMRWNGTAASVLPAPAVRMAIVTRSRLRRGGNASAFAAAQPSSNPTDADADDSADHEKADGPPDAADALAAIDKALADVTTVATAAAAAPPEAISTDTRPTMSSLDLAVEMERRGMIIPRSSIEKAALIQAEHERGHFGREAVFRALYAKKHWWPNMRADIQEEIANCDACARYTVVKSGYNPGEYIMAEGPWEHLQMDCSVHLPTTPDGHTAMLVIIDVFTGFALLRAMKSTTADAVAQHLWDVFTTFGPPKILQSDNGPEFVNDVIRAVATLTGVEHRTISPYNPRADGKVERCIGTVTSIVKKLLHGSDSMWHLLLPWAQYCYNTKVAALTSSAPASLMFGRRLNEFKDYSDGPDPVSPSVENWKLHQEKMAAVIYPAITDRTRTNKEAMIKTWNKHRRLLLNNALPNGAVVMLVDPTRANKFEPKYVGPYHVVRRTRNGTYVLKEPSTGDLLDRHVPPDQLKLVSKKPRAVDLRDNQYEVESILSHRGPPGNYEYLVKWRHYNERTWEPASSFLDDNVIKRYWKGTSSATAVAAPAATAARPQ